MVFNPDGTGASKADEILGEIATAMRAGDFERAALLANSVLALGRHHQLVFSARALAFQQKGLQNEALAEFKQAATLAPNDANLQNAIGVCLFNLNRPLEALAIFDKAIALNPNNADLHFRKGWTHEVLGEQDKATAHYKRATVLDPTHADALGSFAAAQAAAGKIRDAKGLAERALRINANQPTAQVALGIVDLAERNFSGAESRFRSVLQSASLTTGTQAALHGLLADALDGQGRAADAFAAYSTEKNLIRELHAANYAGLERPSETVERITSHVETSERGTWAPAAGDVPSPARTHVFLMGFARSGATLLQQVLAQHPEVVAPEEQDLLVEPARQFLADASGLERLAQSSGKDIDPHRSSYWRGVERMGVDVAGKTFVDTLPMNTIKLPLIAKLFPEARIIFALRDPRDIIQSCYRRHFEVNTTNFEFLSLEDAAGFYASVMELGALCRAKLALREHLHRYEDMVADFDKSTAAVCEFIGVKWAPSLRDFHKDRPLPARASSETRQPLYPEGVGRWRQYAGQLAPALPILEPWVEKFGYLPD